MKFRKPKIEEILVASAVFVVGYLIVSKLFFKKPKVSNFQQKVVDLAMDEFNLWNKSGKVKEGNTSTIQKLRDYWLEGTNTKGSDKFYTDTAWSATFISYLFKKAGAGKDFKYSTSHSEYIRDAIKNKKENNQNPFKGFKPDEVEIEEGDLVCYPRQSGVNYDTKSSYMSHCDVVIGRSEGKDSAISVGGNVSDSVSKTTVPLKNGKIDMQKQNKGYFVVIKKTK
jgi:hypothetical protein